jgi:hypothetical protein
VILEWLPPWAPGLWPRWLPTALVTAGAAVAASVWVWRHWGDRRLDHRVGLVASLLVLAAPAAVGGFIAIRFIGISLLSLAPLAGLGATLLADRVRQRMSSVEGDTSFVRERMQFWSRGRPWRIVLSLVLVLVAPLALLAGARLGRPAAEADAAAQLPPGCRLFSDPSAAAPVLLLRPDVKVWFDSRADYWGRERNLEAIDTLASGDTSRRGVAGANCAMFSPDGTLGTSSMAAALGEDPSWRSTWSGGGITVWVRRP